MIFYALLSIVNGGMLGVSIYTRSPVLGALHGTLACLCLIAFGMSLHEYLTDDDDDEDEDDIQPSLPHPTA
jgi:hypothetical protein